MNNRVLRIITIITICISLLLIFIASQDECHLNNCHEEHCSRCEIIQISKCIISFIQVALLLIFIGFLIYILIDKMKKEERIIVQKSLIFEKVQLNE